MKAHEKALLISEDEMAQHILRVYDSRPGYSGILTGGLVRRIVYKATPDLMKDMAKTVVGRKWNDDDIAWSFTKIVAKKFKVDWKN